MNFMFFCLKDKFKFGIAPNFGHALSTDSLLDIFYPMILVKYV